MNAMQPSRKMRLRILPSDWYDGERCILMIEFVRVSMPTFLVTRSIFIESIDAMNSEESRESFPFDSAFSAVFRMWLKNLSKLTKRLIGNILPSFETYIQFTIPHCGLQENNGQGFCMNLRIIFIGEVIT